MKRLFADYKPEPPPSAPVVLSNFIHVTHIDEVVRILPPFLSRELFPSAWGLSE